MRQGKRNRENTISKKIEGGGGGLELLKTVEVGGHDKSIKKSETIRVDSLLSPESSVRSPTPKHQRQRTFSDEKDDIIIDYTNSNKITGGASTSTHQTTTNITKKKSSKVTESGYCHYCRKYKNSGLRQITLKLHNQNVIPMNGKQNPLFCSTCRINVWPNLTDSIRQLYAEKL